jgi:hypothetical protein
MEYDEPYQAILLILPNWVVMLGIAVAMIVESKAARKMERIRPTVIRTKRIPRGY